MRYASILASTVCCLHFAYPPAVGADQDITSNLPDRWQFTEDTVAHIKSDLEYKDIVRSDSNGKDSPLGAVFHSSSKLTLTSEGEEQLYSLIFDNISKNTSGGVLYSGGALTLSDLDQLVFTNNSAATTTGSPRKTGIVACAGSGNLSFTNIGSLLVQNNVSSNYNGIGFINAYSGSVIFENTGDLTFKDNDGGSYIAGAATMLYSGTTASTGVVLRNTGNTSFENNKAQIIYSFSGVLLSGAETLTFKNNYGVQDGAVIFSRSFEGDGRSIAIVQCGDVIFEGNKAGARGGAIEVELMGNGNTEKSVLLSADHGDIVFKGNTHEDDSAMTSPVGYANPVANAIYIKNGYNVKPPVYGTLDLRAQENREIAFYDPIFTAQQASGYGNPISVTAIDFNKNADASDPATAEYGGNVPSEFKGTIRFSGKEVTNYIIKDQNSSETTAAYNARVERSRYSDVIANATLHNGTLIVEHDAVFGNKDLSNLNTKGMRSSFTLSKGTLDMNNRGVINACDLSFSGIESVIRTDGSSTINALATNMSNGITVDLAYYFSGDAVVDHKGLNINSNTFTLGGTLTIDDSASGFYLNDLWGQDQTFTLFTLKKTSGSFGSFDGILSSAYGSTVVDDMDGYQGIWSFTESGSGNNKVIQAHWTVTGTPVSIPEPSTAVLALGLFSIFITRKR